MSSLSLVRKISKELGSDCLEYSEFESQIPDPRSESLFNPLSSQIELIVASRDDPIWSLECHCCC